AASEVVPPSGESNPDARRVAKIGRKINMMRQVVGALAGGLVPPNPLAVLDLIRTVMCELATLGGEWKHEALVLAPGRYEVRFRHAWTGFWRFADLEIAEHYRPEQVVHRVSTPH